MGSLRQGDRTRVREDEIAEIWGTGYWREGSYPEIFRELQKA